MAGIWIWLCAYLNCTGWILSALHALNRTGYAVAIALGLAAAWIWRKRSGKPICPRFNRSKLIRRFRRPFPLGFLVLLLLAFLGGVFNPPSNYDGLAYREPRMLHWLAEGRWHWIITDFQRLNTRACGYEWVATPVIAFSSTDRLLFLINVASLSLLPGLLFSLFTRAGVNRRVAWNWMWLVPTGYCYLLQAGGIANDMFSAVFALAAVAFALRARTCKSSVELWLSILAMALCTGGKTSNLLLGLPWLVAIFPALPRLRFKPLATAVVLLVAVGASLLPVMALNQWYTKDWSGLAAENIGQNGSLVKFANNVWLTTIQNFTPPVFPMASTWNRIMRQHAPADWQARLEKDFEPAGAHWSLSELESEEYCGIGLGVSLALLASTLAAWRCRRAGALARRGVFATRRQQVGFFATPYISLTIFFFKSGLSAIARLLNPYYGLLLVPWLALPGQAKVVRTKWWRWFGLMTFFVAGVMLIILPGRPLWPAQYVFERLNADKSTNPLLARASKVYKVQGGRADGFAPVRSALPGDLRVLGLVTFDDPEASLWRPFGSRRIEHVTTQDMAGSLKQRNIRYILVNSENFHRRFGQPFADWLVHIQGDLLQTIPLQLRASAAAQDWYLVKLRDEKVQNP